VGQDEDDTDGSPTMANNVISEVASPSMVGPMLSTPNGNRNQTTEQNPPSPPLDSYTLLTNLASLIQQ
jgi:hypothetical protein